MQLDMFSPYKLLLHREVLDKASRGELIYPISCEIDLTNLCNHKCIWCLYQDFRDRRPATLHKSKVFNILFQFKEKGLKSVVYAGGGEPLMHRDVAEILIFTKQLGLETAMVTNGGLLTKGKADTILNTCTFIKFSIDAAKEHTYYKLHQHKGHTLKDVFGWLEYCGKNKTKTAVGVAFLIHPENHKEVLETAMIAKDSGASYIQIRPVLLPGMKFSDEEYKTIMNQLEQTQKLASYDFKPYVIMHRFKEVQGLEKGFDYCMGHTLEGVVTATGEMYLCCIFRGIKKFCLGNLYNQTLEEIWEGEDRKEAIRNIDLKQCPPCRYTKYNEILCYLNDDRPKHANFL
jgi:MoaA/NifB/PqqE/SkfB family radical SAM enzyme